MVENPSLDQNDADDDAFASIFDCFRQGLNAKDDFTVLNHTHKKLNTFYQLSHEKVSKNVIEKDSFFLQKLALRNQPLKGCIYAKIRQDTQQKLQQIRQERRNSQLERQKRKEKLSLASHMIQNEHKKVLIDAQIQSMAFSQHLTHVEESAMKRLKTLLFECIGEIQKSTERLGRHIQGKKDDTASMVRECHRQFEWNFFLQRLEEDIGGIVHFTSLFPQTKMDISCAESQQFEAFRQVIEPFLVKKLASSFVPGETLEIRTIIPVHLAASSDKKRRNSGGRNTDSSLTKSSKGKPKLLMGGTGEDAASSARQLWKETLKNLLTSDLLQHNRRKNTKPKYLDITSSSSSQQQHLDGLASSTGLQINFFTCIECDIPLSSCYIQWLLQKNIHDQRYQRMWNTNIYFNIEEYRRNYNISLSAYERCTHDEIQKESTEMSMYIHQAMERLKKEIFQKYEARLLRGSGHSTMNTGHLDDTLVVYGQIEGDEEEKEEEKGCYFFGRANVLQLLQTVYYTTKFFASLSFEEKKILERMYPMLLLGKNILSTLYIPMVVMSAEQQQKNQADHHQLVLSMMPLKDYHLHELLVMYILREDKSNPKIDILSKESKESSSSSGTVGSTGSVLAQADAMSHLFPSLTMPSIPENGGSIHTQLCVIQNPSALLSNNSSLSNSPRSTNSIITSHIKAKSSTTKHLHNNAHSMERTNSFSPLEMFFVEYAIINHNNTNQTSGSNKITGSSKKEENKLEDKSNNNIDTRKPQKNNMVPDSKYNYSYSYEQWDNLLGGKCYWRSCLATKKKNKLSPLEAVVSMETQKEQEDRIECFGQRKGDLCSWHQRICNFLPSDERIQYLPVIHQQKPTDRSIEDTQEDQTFMMHSKLIQKSSSILEEIQSGQLLHSLQAFFQHVTNGFSNTLYMKDILLKDEGRTLKENKILTKTQANQLIQDLKELESRLASVRDLFMIEAEATKELQGLAHLMNLEPINSFIRSTCWRELEEYDMDIQTDDMELRLQLSQQKCELFRQRRMEKERLKRDHFDISKRQDFNKKERPNSGNSAYSVASSSSSISFSTRNIIRTKIRPQYLSQPPGKAHRSSEVRHQQKQQKKTFR